jgi:gamma-glutamylcyclotransferase (GGCT)/AIG2-like uncharacterized protein YtfP
MIIFDKTNKEIFLQKRNADSFDRLYVAYGANTNLDSMKKRCGDNATYLCNVILDGYDLTFAGMGHCNVEQKEGSQTICALWGINWVAEQQLDIFEGYPTYYDKRNLIIDVDGTESYALIYVMLPEFEVSPATPMDLYVLMVRQGYIQLGLPESQLDDALERAKICF